VLDGRNTESRFYWSIRSAGASRPAATS
jgi:hypothetical protein